MKTELTIEESAHLIDLGVDAKLASSSIGKVEWNGKEYPAHSVFTLPDIINILPKEILHKFDDGDSFTAQLFMEVYEGKWNVGYQESRKGTTQVNLFEEKPKLSLYWVWLPELIDALYKLLCWAIRKGHVNSKTSEK